MNSRARSFIPIVMLVAGVVVSIAIWLHLPGFNGPAYCQWVWRRRDAWRLCPWLAAALLPLAVAQWARRRSMVAALVLAATTFIILELAGACAGVDGGHIARIVESPVATSYYKDVLQLEKHGGTWRQWLADWPRLMTTFGQHSQCKPPGAMLFWSAAIRLFGPTHAATAGGLLIAMLAALAVPATYWLIRVFGGSVEAAWCAGCLMALMPGPVLFFPEFDQIYVPMAAVLVALWTRALQNLRWQTAGAFGLALAGACFFSHIFLMLGFVLACLTLIRLPSGPRSVVQQTGVALLAIVLPYALLWIATGFDPLATYWSAARLQMADSIKLARPFPQYIGYDLLEFGMSLGWVTPWPAILFIVSGIQRRRLWNIAVLCVAQVAVAVATGLFPGETARLFMFMIPLMLAPAGLEMEAWDEPSRWAGYVSLWLVTVALCRNVRWIAVP